MSIGGYILVMVLIFVAYCIGFGTGVSYLLNKIHKLFEYEEYRNIIAVLHMDANKEE